MCTKPIEWMYVCTRKFPEILTIWVLDEGVVLRNIPLPAVRGSQWQLEYWLNSIKAPHTATDDVRQDIGVLNAILLLIGNQEFGKAPGFEWRETVLPAPDGIDFVQLL